MDLDGVFYHGTSAAFRRFAPQPHARGNPTGTMGVFLSADPRIAASFALKAEVVDAGYDHGDGSRSMLRDPWELAEGVEPFEEGAVLLECRAAVRNPHVMSAVDWADLADAAVEADGEAAVAAFKADLVRAGRDSVLVLAWDGSSVTSAELEPCCEYDAPTLCVFDHAAVSVTGSRSACWGWLPEAAASLVPAVRRLGGPAATPDIAAGAAGAPDPRGRGGGEKAVDRSPGGVYLPVAGRGGPGRRHG